MQPLSFQSLPLTPSASLGRQHSSVQPRDGWVLRMFLPALPCRTRSAARAESPATGRPWSGAEDAAVWHAACP